MIISNWNEPFCLQGFTKKSAIQGLISYICCEERDPFTAHQDYDRIESVSLAGQITDIGN